MRAYLASGLLPAWHACLPGIRPSTYLACVPSACLAFVPTWHACLVTAWHACLVPAWYACLPVMCASTSSGPHGRGCPGGPCRRNNSRRKEASIMACCSPYSWPATCSHGMAQARV